jgi:hypothetical protein
MDGWMGIYGESMIISWNIWRIYENMREYMRICKKLKEYMGNLWEVQRIYNMKKTIKIIDKSSSPIYFYGPCLP